jgi:quinol monooxygenase YgiN
MSSLQVIARFSIHDGKLDEFRALAERCMVAVREKDSGTSQYDWFLSDDDSECVVVETYRDSAAVFEHVGSVSEILGELAAVAELKLELFGSPTAELTDALSKLGVRTYSQFQGL